MDADISELETALARGSGRAMLLLSAVEREHAAKALMHACTYNLTYDGQCEAERSEYLARLIEATGQRDAFFAALAAKLQQALPDNGEVHVTQMFRTLARLAASRIDQDGPTIRRLFEQLAGEDRLDVMEAMVRLDGLPALLACITELPADLGEYEWRWTDLAEALRERDGPSADQNLATIVDSVPRLQELQALADERPDLSPLANTYDFAKIRQSLMAGATVSLGGVRKFTENEWAQLVADFVMQDMATGVLPYLRLFGRRQFTGDADALLGWEKSGDVRVSRAAVYALRLVKDQRVRLRALERLSAGQADGVSLLLSNYQAGDLALVDATLRRPATDEVIHSEAMAALDLIEQNAVPPADALPIQLFVYNNTPCSLCRNRVVRSLVEADQAPAWMADECRFDADPGTAQLFVA